MRIHAGSVTCVDWKPFTNTFAACGTDKKVKLNDFKHHKLFQKQKNKTIYIDFVIISLCVGEFT